MVDRIRELDGGQEILTQKLERLERAIRALVHIDVTPFAATQRAEAILDETYPI